MDRLSELVRSHREGMDSFNPPQGHEERFRKRLERRHLFRSSHLFRVAAASAVAGILLTFGLAAMLKFDPFNLADYENFATDGHSPEWKPAYEFYWQRIVLRQNEILLLVEQDAPDQKKEIRGALNEMNYTLSNLKQEIAHGANPDRALQALTTHYQTQLEVLDRIEEGIRSAETMQNAI